MTQKIFDVEIKPQQLTSEALKPTKTLSKNRRSVMYIKDPKKAKKEIRVRYLEMILISKELDQIFDYCAGDSNEMMLVKEFSRFRDEIHIINGDRNLYQEVQDEIHKRIKQQA